MTSLQTVKSLALLLGFAVVTSAAAQKKGDPVKDVEVSMGKPRPQIRATKEEVTQIWGRPTVVAQGSPASMQSLAAFRAKEELSWTWNRKIPAIFSWTPSGWMVDLDRETIMGVTANVLFDESGRVGLIVWQWRGPNLVDMGTVIRALTPGDGFPMDHFAQLSSADGVQDVKFYNLADVVQRLAKLDLESGTGILNREKAERPNPNRIFCQGGQGGSAWATVGDSFDFNPIGQFEKVRGRQLPAYPPPMLWPDRSDYLLFASIEPEVLGSTVPGVDIIIKKCPCSGSYVSLPTGVVGSFPRANTALLGSFNPSRVRERAFFAGR